MISPACAGRRNQIPAFAGIRRGKGSFALPIYGQKTLRLIYCAESTGFSGIRRHCGSIKSVSHAASFEDPEQSGGGIQENLPAQNQLFCMY
jgi:hypothetical protein